MTNITELAQRARINAECGDHLSPAETMELVEALESEKRICATWRTGDGIYCQPTHWMQLPAGPQEVKGE